MRLARRALLVSLVFAVLVGCAPTASLSHEDERALQQLSEVAARDALDGAEPSSVECWVPTEHLVDAGASGGENGDTGDRVFRVLCRVLFEQAGEQRYRDMICVGNLAAERVTEYCDQWAYYSDMPKFEDQRSVGI